MDKLIDYVKENGIITNNDAKNLGYSRQYLSDLTNDGMLERMRPGVYQVKGEIVDDFILLSSNSNRIIFSHHTALYLHDLSDRTPNIYHISVPQGYNASHIKKRNIDVKIHYVKKDLFELGVEGRETPLGNSVKTYNIERTICDIIIDRNKIDKQIFTDAIKRYFNYKNKNLNKLIKYSKVFKIEEEVRTYIEVLL